MTHYYLYISCDGGIVDATTTRFYKVGIGQSAQARRDYLFLTAYSVDKGDYFSLWSEEVNAFFLRCLESVYGTSDMLIRVSHLSKVSARQLVRSLRSEGKPIPLNDLRNAEHVMRYLSINYRFQNRRK